MQKCGILNKWTGKFGKKWCCMHKFRLDSEHLEQYFLEVMSGRRRRWFDRALINVLFVASRFYRMAVQFRVWMYDKRVIRNHALGCLVVSIGNLSCGGTGKTPVVEVFARTLSANGRRVAILSRGYRSKKRTFAEAADKRIYIPLV